MKKIKIKNKKNTGFTLVETLVAISIFTISLIGIMSVLADGIASTNYAKRKVIATYLAQEGIEYIRNIRDTKVLYGNGDNWSQFKAVLSECKNGTSKACEIVQPPFNVKNCTDCKLYVKDGNYGVSGAGGEDSGFVRKVWREIISEDEEIKIFSQVSWMQGSGEQTITFSENLMNWYENF